MSLVGVLLFTSSFQFTRADSLREKQIKTALTLNFIKYSRWPQENLKLKLKIGVIETQTNIAELFKSSLSSIEVRSLPLNVERIDNLNTVDVYDLVYVGDESTYSVSQVYDQISGTGTMLISVDASDKNKTMINIITKKDGAFSFEINYSNIIDEKFKIEGSKLLLLGGSEIDIVNFSREKEKQLEEMHKDLNQREKELAILSQQLRASIKSADKNLEELEKTKKELEIQQQKFFRQKKLLQVKNIAIREKEGELVAVQDELKKSSIELEVKNEELKTREFQLDDKIKTIELKEKEYNQLANSIKNNVSVLSQQNTDIQEQKQLLNAQKENLKKQNILIEQQQSWILFGGIALGLFFLLVIVMSRFNRERKKSNQLLVDRNLILEETRQKLTKAIQQADKANRAKSSFLANMSHEIRTPMSAILGMIHLIGSTRLDRKQSTYILKIETAAKSLLEIINDILDFSKVEAGELKVESIEFKLSDVLDNLSNIVGMQAQQKGLEFIYDIDNRIPLTLVGDPLRLGQILINLANNALKFTQEGEIIISASVLNQERENIAIGFSVSDTGIGMDKRALSSLFKPFTQADNSTTRKFGGTGLGLVISKRLVNKMGGDINVESQPKLGSQFNFHINIKYKNQTNLINENIDGVKLDKKRFLIVENNIHASQALCKYLQFFTKNIDITPLSSFNKTLSSMKNKSYDLVFIDHSGLIEFSEKIKASLFQNKRDGVIKLISNYELNYSYQSIEHCDTHSVLAKPITPSSVYECLMSHFGEQKKIYLKKTLNVTSSSTLLQFKKELTGIHVLLVDDNEINQEIASEILAQVGITVSTTSNGEHAVKKANTEPFDCILMDIQMPVMDGYEATKLIRKSQNKEQLPIIAMTANAMSGDKEKCLATGMNDYVSKPIETLRLYETITKWCRSTSVTTSQSEESKAVKNNLNILCDVQSYHIDLEAGLDLMQGNQQSYFRLLKKFVQKNAELLNKIPILLAQSNYISLTKHAHALNGISGNLGMKSLSEYARRVEEYCRDQESAQRISNATNQLVDELKLTLEEIDFLIETDKKPKKGKNLSDISIEKTIESLQEKIDQQDTESLDLIKTIIEFYSNDEPILTEVKKVEVALNDFDFSTAKSTLQEMLTK